MSNQTSERNRDQEDDIDNDKLYELRECKKCLHTALRKIDDNYQVICMFAPASSTLVQSNHFCSYFELAGEKLLESRKNKKFLFETEPDFIRFYDIGYSE